METTINGTKVQVLYAVCYDPEHTFNPAKFIIEAEFDTLREAKEYRVFGDKEIYVEAFTLRENGDPNPAYWGKSLQKALSKVKKGEKL
jgi:hypothetical protein